VNVNRAGCGLLMIVLGQRIVAGRCSTFVDFGSILKSIETNFKLPSLGYADEPADDLAGCFNPKQSPIAFKTVPLEASYFTKDNRPATTP
jgi:hypothetical protein